MSVRRQPLHAVDDEELPRPFCLLHLQPELLRVDRVVTGFGTRAMRSGTTLAAVVMLAACSRAAGRPRISPHEQTSASVDGVRIVITYGRPSMRGRAIFGAL